MRALRSGLIATALCQSFACGTTHSAAVDASQDASPRSDSTAPGRLDTGVPPHVDLQPTLARFPWNGFRARPASEGQATFPARFVWEPAAGATFYELQLDDGCSIESYDDCEFAGPDLTLTTSRTDVTLPVPGELAGEAPRGRRFFWRVRSCDDAECTEWTTPRYMYLGRSLDDFDGDGSSDLPLRFGRSGPGTSALDRRVQVWRGGPGGLSPERVQGLEHDGGDFVPSYVVPVGDFDGDGYDDLLAAAYRQHADGTTGDFLGALLFRGGGDGLTLHGVAPDPAPDGEWPSGHWRAAPTPVGDVDGDGYDDVVHGNGVLVMFGGPDGFSDSAAVAGLGRYEGLRGPAPTDIDADGFLDIAWLSQGELQLAWRPGGPVRAQGVWRSDLYWEGARGVPNPFADGVVSLTAMHDADGDGHSDVIVLTDNAMYLLAGGRSFADTYDVRERLVDGLRMAQAPIQSGDVDGDGLLDLAVPGIFLLSDPARTDSRQVTVFRGAGEAGPRLQTICDARDYQPESWSEVSALRDYDSDGFADQLWLAASRHRFYLLLFSGGPSGLPWAPTALIETFPDDRYGVVHFAGWGTR